MIYIRQEQQSKYDEEVAELKKKWNAVMYHCKRSKRLLDSVKKSSNYKALSKITGRS